MDILELMVLNSSYLSSRFHVACEGMLEIWLASFTLLRNRLAHVADAQASVVDACKVRLHRPSERLVHSSVVHCSAWTAYFATLNHHGVRDLREELSLGVHWPMGANVGDIRGHGWLADNFGFFLQGSVRFLQVL